METIAKASTPKKPTCRQECIKLAQKCIKEARAVQSILSNMVSK